MWSIPSTETHTDAETIIICWLPMVFFSPSLHPASEMDPLRAQCAIAWYWIPSCRVKQPRFVANRNPVGGSRDCNVDCWPIQITSKQINLLTSLYQNRLRVRWSCWSCWSTFPLCTFCEALCLDERDPSWACCTRKILDDHSAKRSVGLDRISPNVKDSREGTDWSTGTKAESTKTMEQLFCCVLLNRDLNNVKSSFLVPDKPQVNKHQPSFQFSTMWGFCLPRPAGPRSKNVKLVFKIYLKSRRPASNKNNGVTEKIRKGFPSRHLSFPHFPIFWTL